MSSVTRPATDFQTMIYRLRRLTYTVHIKGVFSIGTMALLLDLDEKQIFDIVGFCRPRDMLNVCLSCRTLLSIAQPLLFENVSLDGRAFSAGSFCSRLLLTLLLRQDLAACVKSLKVIGTWPTIIRNEARTSNFPIRQDLISGATDSTWQWLEDGKPDVFFAVLISAVPRLNRLALGHQYISLIGGFNQDFVALRSVTLEADLSRQHASGMNDTGRRDSFLVAHVFSLPSIQHVNMVVSYRRAQLSFRGLHKALQLSSLVFRSSRIPSSDLDYILSMAPKLKVFHYDYENDSTTHPILPHRPSKRHLNAKQLCKSLGHVQETLEQLTLVVSFHGELKHWSSLIDNSQPCWAVHGSLGSLKSFAKLKRLSVPPLLLLGHQVPTAPAFSEVLPPKLQDLELAAYSVIGVDFEWGRNALLSHLSTFLYQFRTHTPDLQTITLRFDESMPILEDQRKNYLNEFYAMCKGAGVAGLADNMRYEGTEPMQDMDIAEYMNKDGEIKPIEVMEADDD